MKYTSHVLTVNESSLRNHVRSLSLPGGDGDSVFVFFDGLRLIVSLLIARLFYHVWDRM